MSALNDRKPTPDGMRGAVLWTDEELALLRDEASRLSDAAANAAAEIVTALTTAARMARPHLVKDVRVLVGHFESEQFSFELRTAEQGLRTLLYEIGDSIGDT